MSGSRVWRSIALHLLAVAALGAAVLVARGMGASLHVSTLSADIAMFAIALMGLVVLYGWSGQISLGHAAFIGVGAYTAALVNPHTTDLPLPWLIDLGAVILVGAVVGLLVGLPSLRISGIQLVVITLGFAEVFQWALNNFNEISGGTQGLLLEHTMIAGFDLGDSDERLIITLVAAALAGVVLQLISRTTAARSMLAVRESEQAAASVGVRPATPKLVAFVLSAIFACVAGWLFAYGSLIVIPGTFRLFDNVFLLTAIIVGGRSTLLGAWLGAVFIVVVPELSRDIENGTFYPVVAGAILIAVMLLAPRGLALMFRSLPSLPGLPRRRSAT